MLVLWITINSFNLQSPLVLILADMRYKLNSANTSMEAFAKMIATMNLVAMACLFEAMCCGIFEHLLAADCKDGGVLGPIFTYYGTIKTNDQEMLYLHCLVWLCNAFHITQLCEQLQADSEYTT